MVWLRSTVFGVSNLCLAMPLPGSVSQPQLLLCGIPVSLAEPLVTAVAECERTYEEVVVPRRRARKLAPAQ